MSTAAQASAQQLHEKARRFRILVIGRANSGKTTILQKICNTTEQPEIFNDMDERVRRIYTGMSSYVQR